MGKKVQGKRKRGHPALQVPVEERARMARLERKMTKVLARFVDGRLHADSCELTLEGRLEREPGQRRHRFVLLSYTVAGGEQQEPGK